MLPMPFPTRRHTIAQDRLSDVLREQLGRPRQLLLGRARLGGELGEGAFHESFRLPAGPLQALLPVAQRRSPVRLLEAVYFLPRSLERRLILSRFGLRSRRLLAGPGQSTSRRFLALSEDPGQWLEKKPVQDHHEEKNEDDRGEALDKKVRKLA